jgi:hypothetical protein
LSANGHLDVLDRLAVVDHALERALVLVQKRQGADERQVLEMIPPRPRAVVPKGQRSGVGIHDQQRAEQALGILVELPHSRPVALGQQARQVCRSRCWRWIARVWARSSSTVRTRQRLRSSSSSSG